MPNFNPTLDTKLALSPWSHLFRPLTLSVLLWLIRTQQWPFATPFPSLPSSMFRGAAPRAFQGPRCLGTGPAALPRGRKPRKPTSRASALATHLDLTDDITVNNALDTPQCYLSVDNLPSDVPRLDTFDTPVSDVPHHWTAYAYPICSLHKSINPDPCPPFDTMGKSQQTTLTSYSQPSPRRAPVKRTRKTTGKTPPRESPASKASISDSTAETASTGSGLTPPTLTDPPPVTPLARTNTLTFLDAAKQPPSANISPAGMDLSDDPPTPQTRKSSANISSDGMDLSDDPPTPQTRESSATGPPVYTYWDASDRSRFAKMPFLFRRTVLASALTQPIAQRPTLDCYEEAYTSDKKNVYTLASDSLAPVAKYVPGKPAWQDITLPALKTLAKAALRTKDYPKSAAWADSVDGHQLRSFFIALAYFPPDVFDGRFHRDDGTLEDCICTRAWVAANKALGSFWNNLKHGPVPPKPKQPPTPPSRSKTTPAGRRVAFDTIDTSHGSFVRNRRGVGTRICPRWRATLEKSLTPKDRRSYQTFATIRVEAIDIDNPFERKQQLCSYLYAATTAIAKADPRLLFYPFPGNNKNATSFEPHHFLPGKGESTISKFVDRVFAGNGPSFCRVFFGHDKRRAVFSTPDLADKLKEARSLLTIDTIQAP